MKKLLVLSLVLAVAGLANAAYTLAYENDQIVIGNTADLLGGINIQVGANGGALVATDEVLPPVTMRGNGAPANAPEWQLVASGPTALSYELPYDGGVLILLWGDAALTPNPAGEWLRIGFAGYKADPNGNVKIELTDLLDTTGEAVTSLSLSVIPEPMTMGLLGLGALFIRKRK